MPVTSLDLITITGKYLLLSGAPASGTVTFTPSTIITNTVADEIVFPVPFTVVLGPDGSFSVQLPATDDPDLTPVGWTYRVSEAITGASTQRGAFEIVVPHDTPGATLDLADVVPAVAVEAVTSYVLVSSFNSHISGPNSHDADAISALARGGLAAGTVGSQLGETVHRKNRPVNLLDAPYNVDPTGVVDATAAINQALALGGPVHAQGRLKVSDSVLVDGQFGVVLEGPSRDGLRLIPTTALAGKPIVMVRNSKLSGVRKLTIEGRSDAKPACGIESREDHGNNPNGNTTTALIVDDCIIGYERIGAGSDILGAGIKWTTAGLDQNNDFGRIDNVDIRGCTGAAYDIGHSNSLVHQISGGVVTNCGHVVKLAGGSFFMDNVFSSTAADFMFDFGPGTYHHPSYASAFGCEGSLKYVRSDVLALQLAFYMVIADLKGAVANGTPIDWNAPNGRLTFVAPQMAQGASGMKMVASSPSSTVSIFGGIVGLGEYRYAGRLVLTSVTHSIGPGLLFTPLDPGATRAVRDNIYTGGTINDDAPASLTPYVFSSPLSHGQDVAAPASLGGLNQYVAFTVTRRQKCNRVLIFVGASAGNVNVAVYGPDLAKISEAVVPCPAAGPAAIVIPEGELRPGRYFVGLAADNTAATFRYRSGLGPLRALSPVRYSGGAYPLPAAVNAGADTTENVFLAMAAYV